MSASEGTKHGQHAPPKPFTLVRKADRVFIRFDGAEEKPAKIVWARPVSGHGREVAILDEKKKELALVPDLKALDAESRRIAEDELERRYLTSRILRVISTTALFGTRYWKVETTRGETKFVIKSINKDVTWISDDHLMIRDALGNRYEIESLAKLDDKSRAEIDKVL